MSGGYRREDGPLATAGGVVVVTQFECRTLRQVLAVWWLHRKVKPDVARESPGFLDVRLYIDWRARRVRSVSLWSDGLALFDMGQVDSHIRAAHAPVGWGVRTSCGVFGYLGDWRAVMFGDGGYVTASPLSRTPPADPEPAAGTGTTEQRN